MNISFGAKIPISEHKVYDRNNQKFVNAKLYELDGKDYSDVEYVAFQNGNWGQLRDFIKMDLRNKCEKLAPGRELYPFDKLVLDGNKFYALENEKGEAIGLLETQGFGNTVNVNSFECDPDKKYKFTGQVMLSAIAKQVAKHKDGVLTVDNPSSEGHKFYVTSCGFEPKTNSSRGLELKQNGLLEFIKNVTQRTQS